MKTTQTTDKATFNPRLDNTAQDFSPGVDKIGALNHNIRCAKSCDGQASWHNPYLADIMSDIESAQSEHAALVTVAEAAESFRAVSQYWSNYPLGILMQQWSHDDRTRYVTADLMLNKALAQLAAVRGGGK